MRKCFDVCVCPRFDLIFFADAKKNKPNNDVADASQCEDNGGPQKGDKFCLFDLDRMSTLYPNCSKNLGEYGYQLNEPCVLIKLNRVCISLSLSR